MKLLQLCLLVLFINLSAIAQYKQPTTPLIDRSVLFDNPEISGGQLSPNGKYISFQKAYNGIMNVWVKKFDEPFTKARRITNVERPLSGYFWTNDSKYIIYTKDKGGNENTNVFAVEPFATAEAATGIPPTRNLTPNDSAAVYIAMVSKKNPDVMYVMINDRDPKWHDLYKLQLASGKLTKIQENKDRLSSWIFDWDENARMATRSNEDGSTDLLNTSGGNNKVVYSIAALENFSTVNFTKDNSKLYIQTDKGNLNLQQLELLDPETGAVSLVEKDPLNKVDFDGAWFSDINREIVYTSYYDAKPRLYWKDKKMEADYNFLKSKFPGAEINFASMTSDERKLLFTTSSDTKVASVYFFDRDTKKIIKQFTPRPKLLPYETSLSPMQPVTYKSSDGLQIPAYLTLPKGMTAKNLPLLVFPHGGPWARDYWGFNGYAQFFANRGFAVLSPNFRGSTGYGKAFLNAGNLQWGKLMQDDITWGVKDLVAKGIADPKRVAILGGSYGGYATLAGLTYTPDVYAAGVDIVGPSNLFTLLNSIPPYWESFRKVFILRMGDDQTEEGKKILNAASPLFSAKNIKAPLMIIQGANDPRVKKPESDQIVVALRDLGRPVDYILADDEGHGFRKPVNNMAMFAAAEKFLAQHIGTRYQASMPADVAKRLKEMTVDIKKVTLAKAPEAKVLQQLPAFSPDLSAGSYQYKINLNMGGQAIPMTMTRTIKENGNNWVIDDAVESPMGKMGDMVTFVKGTLAFVNRTITQGPMSISMVQEGNKVTATAMGKSKDVVLSGAHFTDGAGMDMLIARMPLAEGYTTALATVDATSMQEKKLLLKVKGMEKINGTDTWKVDLVNFENEKDVIQLWIDPVKKMAVKMTSIIPAAGNAEMVMELQ